MVRTNGKKSIKNCKKNKIEIGKKVLCYQRSHIYEAKCLNYRKSSSGFEYLIHYRGWKSKYDEWVPPNRILEYNQENLRVQQELIRNSKKKKRKGENQNRNEETNSESDEKCKSRNNKKKLKLQKSESIESGSANSGKFSKSQFAISFD